MSKEKKARRIKIIISVWFVIVAALVLLAYLFQPHLYCDNDNYCFGQKERCSYYDQYSVSCTVSVIVPFMD